MNVGEMLNNVKAECHPITNIDGIIRRWIDRGQKVVASKAPPKGWPWLRMYGLTFTTAANTSEYALSPLVDTSKIITMYDASVPNHISNMSEQEFRMLEPGPTATGDPFIYRLKGYSPVQNQPSSSSALSLVSSSTSDTAVDVNVQGLNGSSILVSEVVTMNGTTPVSTTLSYTRILSLSKDVASVGTITSTSNAAAVTNVVIAPSDRHVSHPVIDLFNIPDSVDTINYDFTMKLTTLSADDHISLIPEQYHDVIELYAKYNCFKHLNNPTMSQLTLQELELRMRDITEDSYQPSGVWSLNDFEPDTLSSGPLLPSNFPRGT